MTRYFLLLPAWLAAASLALFSSTAFAQETPEPAASEPAAARSKSNFERRPTAVMATLGLLGSPVGMLGAEIEHAPLPWFVLSGGGGLGAQGPQGALGARARFLFNERAAFALGGGASYGPYALFLPCFDSGPSCTAQAVDVLWANAEASLEARDESGLTVKLTLGASTKAACWGSTCASKFDQSRGDTFITSLPYASGSLGYSF